MLNVVMLSVVAPAAVADSLGHSNCPDVRILRFLPGLTMVPVLYYNPDGTAHSSVIQK
jgi:hypothetical protein